MKPALALIALSSACLAYGQDIRGASLSLENIGGFGYYATLHLHLETAISSERPYVILDFGPDQVMLEFMNAVEQNSTIHVEEFRGFVLFDPAVYILNVTEPYHVHDILNIPNSGSTPMILQYMVHIGSLGPNNLPVVSFDVLDDIAYDQVDGLYLFTPQIADMEGDSLTFELIECPHSDYSIPDNIEVNAATGVLSGMPVGSGRFAYCIQINELKNYGFGAYQWVSTGYFTVVLDQDIIQNREELDPRSNTFIWYDVENTTVSVNSNCDLTIYDMTGRVVIDRLRKEANSRFDMTALPQGSYIVHCLNEQDELSILKIAK